MKMSLSEMERADREANEFAMCLLMPEALIRKEMDKHGGRFDLFGPVPQQMAKLFRVSETVMVLRLMQIYRGLKL